MRNSEKIRTFSSSRSSKVIDHGAIESWMQVINSTLDVPCTIFLILTHKVILTHKARKWLIPTPPLFDVSAQENLSKLMDETYPTKTRWIGLMYS